MLSPPLGLLAEPLCAVRFPERGRKKATTLAGGGGNPKILLLDLVYAIAGLGLRGLDLETVLLGRGREEAPDRVFLPIRVFRDLGQSRPLGSPDQFQDLGALALGARRAGFLGVGGFGFRAGLGVLLRRGLCFAPLALLWLLGAPFFGLAPFFEEAFSGTTCERRLLPGYLCASSTTQIATRPSVSSVINFNGGFGWRSNPGNPPHLNTRRR
jgi:hypothetical protein